MKKIFFCLVMALMAVCAHAQVTWNVRAGVGVQEFPDYYDTYYDEYINESLSGWTVAVESNIPFKKGSLFTFSPSLTFFMGIGEGSEELRIMLPLHLGYKIYLNDKLMFCPKLGPTLAYDEYNEFIWGPSIELPLEYKHFVVALQAHTLFADGNTFFGAAFTLGYKF